MSNPTIEIQGIDDIVKMFGKIPPVVKAAIQAAAMEILGRVKEYPDPVAGSKYDRTKKLEKSWNLEKVNDGMGAVIGSSTEAVPYNHIVMDREEQAMIHLFDGWHTVQDYAEEYGPKVNEMVHDAIESVTG